MWGLLNKTLPIKHDFQFNPSRATVTFRNSRSSKSVCTEKLSWGYHHVKFWDVPLWATEKIATWRFFFKNCINYLLWANAYMITFISNHVNAYNYHIGCELNRIGAYEKIQHSVWSIWCHCDLQKVMVIKNSIMLNGISCHAESKRSRSDSRRENFNGRGIAPDGQLVSWCFEPSQPLGIISGLTWSAD